MIQYTRASRISPPMQASLPSVLGLPMSMSRSTRCLVVAVTITAMFCSGCHSVQSNRSHRLEEAPICEPPVTRQIEEPNYNCPPTEVAVNIEEPLTISRTEDAIPWELTLEEAVQITLQNSDVIRNIGGRVLSGPQGAPSVYDVALQEVNPATGVEAALSAFDAQLQTSLNFVRDERAFNNPFIGGGANSLSSNSAAFNTQLSKQSVGGTQFFLRNVTDYNRNNAPVNLFRSTYDTRVEGEFRHPLLRGRGVDVNRITGPNAGVGSYNGVVIARIRTDIALADFELSVRTLIRDVENAYWQLYFAYRALDARTAAYEAALASWQTVKERLDFGTADIEVEALARANFYQAKIAMQNALGGGTANSGIAGVFSAERNLRRLLGVPANDGRLIRPAEEPTIAKRVFDWHESIDMALGRRVELRRQRWTIKQRENELLASKNYLLSQLDLIGLYRWRGFGDGLLGNRDIPNGSAFSSLYSGALQGWQLGLQFSTPLGKRREHAAVRSAELRLARERAVLRNQELTISNNLSSQFAEMERTYEVARASFNRSLAERQRLEAANAKYDAGEELLEFVLQAQQRTADADSSYYQASVDYSLAVSNMHVNRGSYLDYMGVQLSEGPWCPDHYRSYRKEFRRFKPKMNYCLQSPRAVSRGAFNQTPTPSATYVESSMSLPFNELPGDYFENSAPTPAADPATEILPPTEAPSTPPVTIPPNIESVMRSPSDGSNVIMQYAPQSAPMMGQPVPGPFDVPVISAPPIPTPYGQ